MAEAQRLASQSLKTISQVWQIDDARSKWSEDGFEWWPGDFRVLVKAQTDERHRDPETCRLVVRTDFLRDVPIAEQRFSNLAPTLGLFMTSTYAWVYLPADAMRQWEEKRDEMETNPKMWFMSCVYVTADNMRYLPNFLAQMAIMQPINAQIQSHHVSELIGGGTPDTSRPEHLADAGLDEMLEVASLVYCPIGQEENRWKKKPEFAEFADQYGKNDNCFGFGDENGLSLETPFGSDTALIRAKTDEKHPQLGTGLLVTLQLPRMGEDKEIGNECAYLNFLEAISWTGFPLLGCWHPHRARGETGIAFTTFIPNALYQPFIATNLALWMLGRARWVRQTLWPDLEDKKMIEILEERFGPSNG
jgi:hypothetical protein